MSNIQTDGKLQHELQAATSIIGADQPTDPFFKELSPLFAGSLFCLIREDPEKIAKEPSKPKVIHTTALSEEARLDYQRAGYGIFFTVNAFRDGKRDAEHLEALKALYVDIDAPKALKDPGALDNAEGKEALRDWKRSVFAALTGAEHEARKTFPYLPTLVVETKNGFHAYWYLESFIHFEEADLEEALANPDQDPTLSLYAKTTQQLIKLYGGDPGAKDISRVLRSPFSWHLKGGKADAYPCLPVFYDPEARTTLEDYASAFKPAKQVAAPAGSEPELVAPESFMDHFIRAFKPDEDLTPAEKQECDAEVLAKYPKRERPSIRGLMNPTGTPEGSRNASLFCVVSALREDGFSRDQVESEFRATGYNGLKDAEILSVIASAYKSIRPKSFGWNDPIASAYRTPEEEAQVKALYREAISKRVQAKKPKPAKSTEEQSERPPSILPVPLGSDRGAPELIPSAQKRIYNTVELLLAEALPKVKYLEGLGFHEKVGNIYAPIKPGDLSRRVSDIFRSLGLTNYQTDGPLKSKFSAWSSLPQASVDKRFIEPGVGDEKTLDENDVLPLANGILDLLDRTIRPYHEREAWRFVSPIEYHPEADCPRWKQFIKEVTQDDHMKARLLQEIAGYCLTSSTVHQKGFILVGEGSNGKSVFASTIQYILGSRLQSSITMETLQSNFGIGNIEGIRLNVINEISDHYMRGDILKRLIDGSQVTVDKKNADHRTINPFAKFIFTVNRLPQVDEISEAIARRLIIVKFNRIFRGAEINPSLERDLQREASGILNWALDGLAYLRDRTHFTQTAEQLLAMEEFKETSSHLISFLRDKFDPLETSSIEYPTSGISISAFCERFTDYCLRNNYRRMGTKRVLTDINSLIAGSNLPKGYSSLSLSKDRSVYGLKPRL